MRIRFWGNWCFEGWCRGGDIEAEEFVFGAEIEAFVGENGSGPAGIFELGDLAAGEFLGFLRVDAEKAEQPGLTKDEELAIGHEGRAAAVGSGGRSKTPPAFIPFPHELPGFQFHTAEAGVGFITAIQENRFTIESASFDSTLRDLIDTRKTTMSITVTFAGERKTAVAIWDFTRTVPENLKPFLDQILKSQGVL